MPMPNEKLPEIIVFAGPNGSGKMNNLFGRISIGMKCLCVMCIIKNIHSILQTLPFSTNLSNTRYNVLYLNHIMTGG